MVYCDYTASGPLPAVRRALPAEPAARLREHAHRGRPHGPQHEPAAARGRGDHQDAGERGTARPHRGLRHRRDRRDRQAAADPRRVARRRRRARSWARSCASSSATRSSRPFAAISRRASPSCSSDPTSITRNEVTWRQGLATVVEVNLARGRRRGPRAPRAPAAASRSTWAGSGSARSRPPRTSPACARRCTRSRGCCTRTRRTRASITRRARPTSRST